MSLFEAILRNPITVLDIADTAAFKEGPETFNLYRLALENGPDLNTDALLRVVTDKGLTALQMRCVALLGGNTTSQTSRTMRMLGDPFLSSYEWATIRMRALKLYGSKCQCCGATSKDGSVINVDHIKPRRTHPELALDVTNLQILCGDCNKGKGNWDQTDWREHAGEVGGAGAEQVPT